MDLNIEVKIICKPEIKSNISTKSINISLEIFSIIIFPDQLPNIIAIPKIIHKIALSVRLMDTCYIRLSL